MNTSTPFKPFNNSFAWFRPQALSLGSFVCKEKIRELRKQYPRHFSEAFQFIRECLTLAQFWQKAQDGKLLAEQAKPEEDRRDIPPVSSDSVAYLLAALQGLIESYVFVQIAMFPDECQSKSGDEDDYVMIAELARDAFKFAQYQTERLLDGGVPVYAEAVALHVLLTFENRKSLEVCPDELLEILAVWQGLLAKAHRHMAEELEAKVKERRQRSVELNSSRKQYYNAAARIWTDFLEQLTVKSQQIKSAPQPICCAYDLPVRQTRSDERGRILHLRFHVLVEKQEGVPSYDVSFNLERLAQYIWNSCNRKMLSPGRGIEEICHDRVWVGTLTYAHDGTRLNLLDPRISLWTTWEGEDSSSKEERDWCIKEADPIPLVLNLVDQNYEAALSTLPLNDEGRLVLRPGGELHMVVPSDGNVSFFLPTELFDLTENRESGSDTVLVFKTRSSCFRGWRLAKLIVIDSSQGNKRYEVPISVEGIYKVDLSL